MTPIRFRLSRALATLTLLIAALTLALPAQAQTLTGDQVRGFIASLDALNQSGIDPQMEPEGDPWTDPAVLDRMIEAMRAPISFSVAELRGTPEEREVRSIVTAHGFRDLESWGRVGDRVILAYAYLSFERDSPGDLAEMQAMRAEMEGMDLSATDPSTALMFAMMQGAMAMLDAPQADRDAVRPHMADLDRVMVVEE